MGKQWKQWQTIFFLASKITADGGCSHQIKRRLLLGRKVMTNLDCILKSRDITLPTKVCLVKAMIFPAVMYGFESWTIKKAECQRIDAFELRCWKRLLRVPGTARRSTSPFLRKSILNIYWKDWCWSWNSKTLATWCKELTHLERHWCWKRLKAGGEGDDRGWDGWMASLTQWTWVWAAQTESCDGQESLTCCSPWGRKESDTTERLNWTEDLLAGSPLMSSCVFVGKSHFVSISFLKVILFYFFIVLFISFLFFNLFIFLFFIFF